MTTVAIFNRGEIAVRMTQTLQAMGCRVVAVYADEDADAPHVLVADAAYPLHGQTAAETYLKPEKLLFVARQAGVDAVHPGYGFLSENAGFAAACQAAGLIWIGPSPEAIRAMGDKVRARQRLQSAGVPLLPGWEGTGGEPVADIQRAADALGYPVLVKASAGGGGKGMRVVHDPADLPAALEAAAREAQSAFGDARVYLEKFLVAPRHIEIQVLGDHLGQVIHLLERDCSLQRRHQKVLEEAPSPVLPEGVRQAMGAAAVRVAQAIGYTNAGTVEFLLDPASQQFYFLEMNTRLQVEHPVTECITGLDLVREQVRVALGEPLPLSQDEVRPHGHAIECRLYAEDPARGFLPATGTLHVYRPPTGPGIRVDSGVREGQAIGVHFDPMLAKLITWGRTRAHAIDTLRWALDHFPVLGVTTNLAFLRRVVDHPVFLDGAIHTQWLSDPALLACLCPEEAPSEAAWAAAALGSSARPGIPGSPLGGLSGSPPMADPWQTLGAWSNV